MARALNAGPAPRRRVAFGLLDADGWGWASFKAFVWFIVIIFLLAYIPDRAYYFTVNRTLDLGILAVSPINFCPPENRDLPCPAPQGAVLPWDPAPQELALPAQRTGAGAVQIGTNILLVGGSDGATATADVFVAPVVGTGNFDRWTDGPALPEPRSDAAVTFFGGSVYVVGGRDADGSPTGTTFVLTPDPDTGELGEWQTAEAAGVPLDLPEPRAGAAIVSMGDGLLVVGGTGEQGATNTVWKSSLSGETLGEWDEQQPLYAAVTDALVVQNGDYIWVLGGTDANGNATGVVQRGTVHAGGTGDDHGAPTGDPAPATVDSWGVRDVGNLPEARTHAAGFAANGSLYVIGGSDGTRPRGELYWAVPRSGGGDLGDVVDEWKHLAQSDLPAQGLAGAASLASGPHAFVFGGTTSDGPTAGSARAGLAPQEPFFQLGLVGIRVPALQIEGEIGQQLGYLNAAGVGGLNFAILIVIGWMFAHPAQTRALWERVRSRRKHNRR